MESKQDKLTRLQDRKMVMEKIREYSIKRIDILIISISGAGILLCLETLKFLIEEKKDNSLTLKISGVCFLLAIIVNFWSQFLAHESSENEIEGIKAELKDDEVEYRKYYNASDRYGRYVGWMNNTSSILMTLGLLFLLVYFCFTF